MIKRRKISKKSNKKKSNTPPMPVPLFQIRINVMNNGAINVQGFPKNLDLALNAIDQGKNAVVKWFIQQAKENRLNNYNIVDGENIIVPKKGLLKL